MQQPIDFGGLAATLLGRAHQLVPQWLPGGVERNGRYYVGDFDGSDGESANVNLVTGTWIDNGGGADDRGGDLLSLYRRVFGHHTMLEAAKAVMRDLGMAVPGDDDTAAPGQGRPRAAAPAVPEPPAPAPRPERWRPVSPVPDHAPHPQTFRTGWKDKTTGQWVDLHSVAAWEYRRGAERFGYVARFERIDSKGRLVKETLPFTWCEDTEDPHRGQRWHSKQWPAPRPLYLPAGVLSAPDARRKVLLVEGEKCAAAAHAVLGAEWDVVSWPGGCKAWQLADWAWLQGRAVWCWPDADAQRVPLTRAEKADGVDPESKPFLPKAQQPGWVAMLGIGTLLEQQHQCTVHVCAVDDPGRRAPGWDVADAIADGWGPAQLQAHLQAAMPLHKATQPAAAGHAEEGISTPTLAGAGKGGRPPAASGGGQGDGRPAWRDRLLYTSRGAIVPCRENVVVVLDGVPEQGIHGDPDAEGCIAFNEFTNDVLKLRETPWGTPAGVWDETDELELGNWLVREHGLPSMPRGTLEEAVAMVAKRHRYHPVRQQLERLRGKWDGWPRLAMWLRHCCLDGDDHDPEDPLQQYLSRVGKWLLMAICARVLTPGCKFDYMTIFEGGQGLGKSTLASILGGEYFADTGLVLGDKDSYQNLQGVLVYEWGELDSLSKADVTRVKQFISSASDRFRASFDRRPKDYPRQVVFVGTTNEDHYLVDPTGNRRMWPVRVTKHIDLEWLRANREQLFAEALTCLDRGERFHPDAREQRELFEPQQQQRQVENAIEAAVLRYLYDDQQRVGAHAENGTLVNDISVTELLTRLGVTVEKQTHVLVRQATSALRHAGWLRYRSSRGDRPWMFKRPAGRDGTVPSASASPASPAGSGSAEHPQDDGDECPW